MSVPMCGGCLNNVVRYSCGVIRNTRYAGALSSWRSCATTNSDRSKDKPKKNIEELFLRTEVQSILKTITGFDLDKIFRKKPTANLTTPKYKLLTEKQLQKYKDEATEKGREKLQMPPVKQAWSSHETSATILSEGRELDGFDTSGCRYIFTDITFDLPRRNRVVVIREPGGVLRLADHEERDRVLQVYYPAPGKMYNVPKMFEEEKLEKVLGQHKYEYVLDRACIQFEPDDPNYIRVTQRTYEHLASQKMFDTLRSTRHFGPMAFYFALHRKIDLLLIDMLQRDMLPDAEELVKLYHIIHPECQSAQTSSSQKTTGTSLIELFAKHDAVNGGIVEMALQSYEEAGQRSQTSTS